MKCASLKCDMSLCPLESTDKGQEANKDQHFWEYNNVGS